MTSAARAGPVGVVTTVFGGPAAQPGAVYLVGGGPGDPGLLTVRAARLLATAEVVAYDRLAPPAALQLCPADSERVYVGKQPDRHALTQEDINALLVERARSGRAVVRLKGGDPFVLARGSEEAQACAAAGLPFEVVPGITSGVAAPAYAGIPATHRAMAPAFAVVTGHEDPTKDATQVDYAALAAFDGTLLLYMGVGRIRAIATALVEGGKDPDTPVALVRWGTTPHQQTLVGTLSTIADQVEAVGFANPAVIVVGDVVSLRSELSWFEHRPLHGRSVLVARTRQQASELSARLRALGAEAVEAPTIAIEPTADPTALEQALRAMVGGDLAWVAFTSANGVDAAVAALHRMGEDARAFAGVRIAAVGPGTTAALHRVGLRPDLLPERFTTRGLAGALAAESSAPILLPRADIATPVLAEALRDAGWDVRDVEAYRTVRASALPDGVRERIAAGEVDILAFASSSTVRNFVELFGEAPPERTLVVSIGPVTSATCRELRLRVDAEADPHDLDGLVDAVVAAVDGRDGA